MMAPQPVFPAALETLQHATTCVHDWATANDASVEMLSELLESIRVIPQMLQNWEHYQIEDIVSQLAVFDHRKWRAIVDADTVLVPDLVRFFNQRI